MENDTEFWKGTVKAQRRGKIFGGLLLVAAGCLFMAREMGEDLPDWIFTWKTLLIALGLVSGVKHGFRRLGWLIPVFAGLAFLVADLYPEFSIRPFLWPSVLILIGLVMIFKPSRKRQWKNQWSGQGQYRGACARNPVADITGEEFVDSTSVFGGVKKNVICKNFRGGDITNVFGGSEIDLTQADFEEKASLEITQVFGGTRLIVPANWQIKSSLVTVLGSIEDKRPPQAHTSVASQKQLMLTGTTFCGGIEINTY